VRTGSAFRVAARAAGIKEAERGDTRGVGRDKGGGPSYTDRVTEGAAAGRLRAVPADLVPGRGTGGSKRCSPGGTFVSIVRVGLAETKKFAEGYDAIFSKKKKGGQARKAAAPAKASAARKKKAGKKK
jgi:hypothetical protein